MGDIVIRADDKSPAEKYGGTWEKIAQGRAIIGASDEYLLNSTGGSADAVVVEHSHPQNIAVNNTMASWKTSLDGVRTGYGYLINFSGIFSEGYSADDIKTADIGENGVGKNMMPYLALNIWQKIA